MKIYKTQEEVEKDIVNGVLKIDGDVKFGCNISINAGITAGYITARDINAGDINAGYITAEDINAGDINAEDINAWDINAEDINAEDINAEDITARDINAEDITAGYINAEDINARDINAEDINAGDIRYHAFCCAYKSIKCKSWTTKRDTAHPLICLDGELILKRDDKIKITVDGKDKYMLRS